jgi:Ankyrin repeats (3 copies)
VAGVGRGQNSHTGGKSQSERVSSSKDFCGKGCVDRLVAKLLFAIVALLIVPAANGQTDLIVAASRGDVATVNALLARGVDPNQADERTGLTPLTQSSLYGHVEVVRLLLRAGADLNRASKDGLTALTQACVKGQIEVLDFLLSKGADVNSRSVTSFTPLMWTAAVGQTNRKTVTAKRQGQVLQNHILETPNSINGLRNCTDSGWRQAIGSLADLFRHENRFNCFYHPSPKFLHTRFLRGLLQIFVERGQRYATSQGQFKIGGVVRG